MKQTKAMKRCTKIILVAIMLVGIAFSISNFLPVEIEAVGINGHLETVGGSGVEECYPPGTECSVGMSPGLYKAKK